MFFVVDIGVFVGLVFVFFFVYVFFFKRMVKILFEVSKEKEKFSKFCK